MGKQWKLKFSFLGLQNYCRWWLQPWNASKKSYDKSREHNKKQRHCFANKGQSSQSYGFSSSHICTWELDHKESWALKNWCFWTVVLKKTLESPLGCKEIQPVHPKGNQSWICPNTGMPGVLQSMELQRVEQDWVTEWQQWWFKKRGMVSWYRLGSVSFGANVTV